MKPYHIQTVLLILTLLIYNSSLSQLYFDKLPTVVITSNNHRSLLTYNEQLLTKAQVGNFNFKAEITHAVNSKAFLVFVSENHQREIEKSQYLKQLRKAANRSVTFEHFKRYLHKKYPVLFSALKDQALLQQLYAHSRPQTFNGSIDSLPSVL